MFGGFRRLMIVAFDLLKLLPAMQDSGNGRPWKLTADDPEIKTRNFKLAKKILPQNKRRRCFHNISGERV